MDKGLNHGVAKGLDHGVDKGLDHGVDKGLDHRVEKGLDHGVDKALDHGVDKGLDHGVDKRTGPWGSQGTGTGTEFFWWIFLIFMYEIAHLCNFFYFYCADVLGLFVVENLPLKPF